jgi:2,3-bisphosphoglycerate-independent phosphoglycerate mutase
MKTPLTLIIMDGYGLAPAGPGNAVTAANTPNLDRLLSVSAHSTLAASGLDVGLPPGQIGNSEVGHMNIRRRPAGLSGSAAHHQGDRGRYVFENKTFRRRWTPAGKREARCI